MKRTTAIITDVRYRMSLALIRDLAQSGVRVVAVEFDGKTSPLGFYSKYAERTFFADEDNYLDQLYELCKDEMSKSGAKPALIPVGTATMNKLVAPDVRFRFEEVAGLALPGSELLELLNDKEKLHDLAEKLGVPVPKEYEKPYDEASFPCVVKPWFGEKFGLKAAERYKIVENKIQLKAAVEHYETICGKDSVVVQQYLSGGGFGCSVFAEKGKVKASITHQRIREYPISGGPSSCCKVVHIGELQDYAELIVKELSFTGVAMFEFKQDSKGRYYLLECNPRVWGSYPLTRCAKCNISQKWFEAAYNSGNPHANYKAPSTDFTDVRMHYILSDLMAGIGYIKNGQSSLGFDAFADVFRPSTKGGLFEWGDIKPSLKYLGDRIKGKA